MSKQASLNSMEKEERTLDMPEEGGSEETPETEPEGEGTEGDEPEAAEGEETPEVLKEKLKEAEDRADKAKKDLLALKASRREAKRAKPEANAAGASGVESAIDLALNRRNEQSVLRKTVDENSPFFIPELVEEKQYRQIIGYLPRNMDRSTEEGIHKALKLAVVSWKADRGDGKVKDRPNRAAAEAAASGTGPGGGGRQVEAKPSGFKLLKKQQEIGTWYAKKT